MCQCTKIICYAKVNISNCYITFHGSTSVVTKHLAFNQEWNWRKPHAVGSLCFVFFYSLSVSIYWTGSFAGPRNMLSSVMWTLALKCLTIALNSPWHPLNYCPHSLFCCGWIWLVNSMVQHLFGLGFIFVCFISRGLPVSTLFFLLVFQISIEGHNHRLHKSMEV